MKKFKIIGLLLIAFFATSCLNSDETYTVMGPGGDEGNPVSDTNILKTLEIDASPLVHNKLNYSPNGYLQSNWTESTIDIFFVVHSVVNVNFVWNNSRITNINTTFQEEINGAPSNGEKNSTVTYNAEGKVEKIVAVETGSTPSSQSVDITYNGNVATAVHKYNNEIVGTVVYTFNANNQLIDVLLTPEVDDVVQHYELTWTGNNPTSFRLYYDNTLESSGSYTYDSNPNPITEQDYDTAHAILYNNILNSYDNEYETYDDLEDLGLGENNTLSETLDGEIMNYSYTYNSDGYPISVNSETPITYTYY